MPEIKAITLMGATASGKTELALELARRCGGEIVSVDSKQIYQRLEAGTAKPRGTWTETPEGRFYLVEGIPYHLVDELDPRAAYDAGSFVKAAGDAIAGIRARGRVPVLAGGTGMYVQAFWNGLDELPPADPLLRQRMAETVAAGGKEALHAELVALDPDAARGIPPGNVQRVMRAIEITRQAGRPVSQIWSGSFFNALPTSEGKFVFLKWKKELLAERVKQRTAANFDAWAEETRALLADGYPEDCPGLKSLGYPQVMDYLAGRLPKTEALHAIAAATMGYAKRQNTWFARYKNAAQLEIGAPGEFDPPALAEKIINS